MRKDLSKLEKWWLGSWPHRWHIRRFVPRFLKACPDPFRGEVLEVGAGGGFTSRRIMETFPQVELTASDRDDQAKKVFERMQRLYGKRLTFVVADLAKLPFDREAFDIVVAISVLHYVASVEEAIRQLIRVTRPGGLIGIAGENLATSTQKITGWWRQAAAVGQPQIEQILTGENCEVLVAEGDEYYYVWARKPYPITPGE